MQPHIDSKLPTMHLLFSSQLVELIHAAYPTVCQQQGTCFKAVLISSIVLHYTDREASAGCGITTHVDTLGDANAGSLLGHYAA